MVAPGGVTFSWMSGLSLPGAVGYVVAFAVWVVFPAWLIRRIRSRNRRDGQGDGD